MSLVITPIQKQNYLALTGIEINSETEAEINRVSQYANSIGLKFTFQDNPEKIEYSDNVCYLSQSSAELDIVEFMIHNLCHYIVASPSRREMADFGLGNSPDTHNYEVERYTTALVAELEETLTIKLTSYFYKHFNLKTQPSLIRSRVSNSYDLVAILKRINVIDEHDQLTHQIRNIEDDEQVYIK